MVKNFYLYNIYNPGTMRSMRDVRLLRVMCVSRTQRRNVVCTGGNGGNR